MSNHQQLLTEQKMKEKSSAGEPCGTRSSARKTKMGAANVAALCARCEQGTDPKMCGDFAIHPTSYDGSPHPQDICNRCGHTRECHTLQPAQDAEYPACDYCGVIPDHHPWHGSGVHNGEDNPHIHACSNCRHKLPTPDVSSLVDALESAKNLIANHSGEVLPDNYAGNQIERIDDALAAYRNGGEL